MASGGDCRKWTPSSGPVAIVAVKVLPSPTRLSTVTVPPSAAAILRLMASPNPVPPNCRVTEGSAWTNGSKMVSSLSAGIPMPVSITWIASCGRPSVMIKRATICTAPASVNLMALPTRFINSWRRRAGSVWMVSGIGPAHVVSSRQALFPGTAPATWKRLPQSVGTGSR